MATKQGLAALAKKQAGNTAGKPGQPKKQSKSTTARKQKAGPMVE